MSISFFVFVFFPYFCSWMNKFKTTKTMRACHTKVKFSLFFPFPTKSVICIISLSTFESFLRCDLTQEIEVLLI